MNDAVKQEHLGKAGKYLAAFASYEERIGSPRVRDRLRKTAASLRNLRDTEEYFESGEKELDQLYGRYLPYLDSILQEYILMEGSANYDAIHKTEKQLIKTLDLLKNAMDKIRNILPEDEIAEAKASAQAEKMKRKLDQRSLKQ